MVSEPSKTNVMSIIKTSSSSSFIPQLSQVTLLNYNFPFKLEQNNYMIWRAQILPAIIGSNLEGFVTGTIQSPQEWITDSTKEGSSSPKSIPNPEYQHWRRLDQALLGWIKSSISPEVQTQLTQTETCLQLWNSLSRLFGTQNRAKVMQLKLQLQSTRKEGLSITEYYTKLKEVSDNLSMPGYMVSTEDLFLCIFL